MKMTYLAVSLTILTASFLNGKEIVLDKIIARVNGRNILKSQLTEPRLSKGGQPYNLDEMLTDEIVFQKAEELGNAPSPTDLESAINAEKIEFGGQSMSDEEFEVGKLKKIGLTFPQYRVQLYRFYSTEYLLGRLISNKLVIPAQEIEEFYKKNPIYSEEKFHIMIAPTKKDISRPAGIRWDDLGWFTINELDNVYHNVIKKLKPGQATARPINKDGKLMYVLLKDHKLPKLASLSSRYNDIKAHLREIRREPFVKKFVNDIKKEAFVSYP